MKMITFTHKTINSSDQFPLGNYTSVFKEIFKYLKSPRLHTTHKIESTIPLSVIKYGNKNQLSNISTTLVNHNVYLSNRKFESHKEHSVGFISNINPKIILRDSFRQKKSTRTNVDRPLQIDLNAEENNPMIHKEKRC